MSIKKIFISLIVVFVVIILIGIGGVIYLQYGQEEVHKTELNGINLSDVEDGTYTGEFEGYRWDTKVKVIVENHEITEITVIDDQVFNDESVKEEIINQVIKQQSTNVDTVSGATISSKAYLKAIESALEQEN